MKVLFFAILFYIGLFNLYAQDISAIDSATHYILQSDLKSAEPYLNKIDPQDYTPNILFYKGLSEIFTDEQATIIDLTKCLNKLPSKRLNEMAVAEIMRTHLKDGETFAMNELFGIKFRDAYYWRASSKFDLKDYYGCIADIKTYHVTMGGSHTARSYLLLGKGYACTERYITAIFCFNDIINRISLKTNEQQSIDCVAEAYYYRGMCELILNKKIKGNEDLSKASELGYTKAQEQLKDNSQQLQQ